jgi:ketosteroid isomerase-like protein
MLLCGGTLYAQHKQTEAEIRKLEQTEVRAILQKDSVTLLKLWDKDYVVNSPENMIFFAGKTTLDRPVLKRSRTAFTREIEQIIVRGNTVISMGSENVIPGGDDMSAGKTVKRRYTNIWMKLDGNWKLVARHASIICAN